MAPPLPKEPKSLRLGPGGEGPLPPLQVLANGIPPSRLPLGEPQAGSVAARDTQEIGQNEGGEMRSSQDIPRPAYT